jgi:hypothetical protein
MRLADSAGSEARSHGIPSEAGALGPVVMWILLMVAAPPFCGMASSVAQASRAVKKSLHARLPSTFAEIGVEYGDIHGKGRLYG